MAKSKYQTEGNKRDVAYRQWIRNKRPVIQAELVRPFLEASIRMNGNKRRASMASGVSERLMWRMMSGRGESFEYQAGVAIAASAGMEAEFHRSVPPPGSDDWSRHGRFCGDGSGPLLDGCGTFHHEHYLDGLCSECWQREIAGVEGVPRDVRESKLKGDWDCRGVRGRSGVRAASAGDDSSGQLSLL